MAAIDTPNDPSAPKPRMAEVREPLASPPGTWFRRAWAKRSPVTYVLAVFGYFLLLGSVAVVVVTEQFPWFTLAPITILLSLAYFRYEEEKEARRSSRDTAPNPMRPAT